MQISPSVRDLDAGDLADLDWSGGPEHLRCVADALTASYTGDVVIVVIALPNDRLVGLAAADFRPMPQTAVLWMLSVHERFQSLGVGTLLVRALEQRAADRGCRTARLGVEHDNPRAAALYRRLGYRERGTELDAWPVAGGRTYVTVCTVLERDLVPG